MGIPNKLINFKRPSFDSAAIVDLGIKSTSNPTITYCLTIMFEDISFFKELPHFQAESGIAPLEV